MRRALLFLLLVARPLAAQIGTPWRLSNFPYVMGDPTNGLVFVGHIQYAKEADYSARAPYDGYFGADVFWGTRGSRGLTGKIRVPFLIPGWRFAFDGGMLREGRFGYYGQGPGGERDFGVPEADQPNNFFRVHRDRYYARGEVTRRLKSQLHLAAAGGFAYSRFVPMTDGDAFKTDYGDNILSGSDLTGRLSLVWDSRDHELVTTKGALLEAGVAAGSARYQGPLGSRASGSGYAGAYLNLRGYYPVLRTTTVAGRLALRGLGANAPLDARYQFSSWERDLTVYGGADSQRGFVRGRFVGRGVLLSSLEVRHILIDVGDYGAVSVLAFFDGGRVFEGSPSLTLSEWKTGGGLGMVIRVVRAAVLAFNFAKSADGFTFSMSNAWAF